MKRTSIVLALTMLLVAGGCASTSRDSVRDSVVRLAGTVCRIPIRAGGVVIDTDVVLTAAHVIAGTEEPITVVDAGGTRHSAEVVGFDPERDLALLLVPSLEASWVGTARVEPGASGFILVVGGEPGAAADEYDFVVNRRINATGEDIYGEGDVSRGAIELVADVEPGVSGAAAFDGDGRVIGIVFAESRGRGVTYAVDATEIEAFISETDTRTLVVPGRCR